MRSESTHRESGYIVGPRLTHRLVRDLITFSSHSSTIRTSIGTRPFSSCSYPLCMPAPATQAPQSNNTPTLSSVNQPNPRPRRNGPRRPRPGPPDSNTPRPPDALPDESGLTPRQSNQSHRPPRGPGGPPQDGSSAHGGGGGGKPRPPRRRNPNAGGLGGASNPASAANSDVDGGPSGAQQGRPPRPNRRNKFGSGLTKPGEGTENKPASAPAQRYAFAAPEGDDLTSTLIRELRTAPYPDCPICFNAIHPAQPTWSCSPSTPVAAAAEGDNGAGARASDTAQCCWTTFHLKCIKSWAGKSVKDLVDAWRARGEERMGEWRCPGCQAKRISVPNGYW